MAGTVRIPLGGKAGAGLYALVDVADAELVSQRQWHAKRGRCGTVYAVTNVQKADGTRMKLYMHQIIMHTRPGEEIDHINRNGLDNRRANLRLATSTQNQGNRIKITGTSSLVWKGVMWHRQTERWRAKIMVDSLYQHLGYFDSVVDAAMAYDAAHEAFGPFARPNFPERAARLAALRSIPSTRKVSP